MDCDLRLETSELYEEPRMCSCWWCNQTLPCSDFGKGKVACPDCEVGFERRDQEVEELLAEFEGWLRDKEEQPCLTKESVPS